MSGRKGAVLVVGGTGHLGGVTSTRSVPALCEGRHPARVAYCHMQLRSCRSFTNAVTSCTSCFDRLEVSNTQMVLCCSSLYVDYLSIHSSRRCHPAARAMQAYSRRCLQTSLTPGCLRWYHCGHILPWRLVSSLDLFCLWFCMCSTQCRSMSLLPLA